MYSKPESILSHLQVQVFLFVWESREGTGRGCTVKRNQFSGSSFPFFVGESGKGVGQRFTAKWSHFCLISRIKFSFFVWERHVRFKV